MVQVVRGCRHVVFGHQSLLNCAGNWLHDAYLEASQSPAPVRVCLRYCGQMGDWPSHASRCVQTRRSDPRPTPSRCVGYSPSTNPLTLLKDISYSTCQKRGEENWGGRSNVCGVECHRAPGNDTRHISASQSSSRSHFRPDSTDQQTCWFLHDRQRHKPWVSHSRGSLAEV